MFVLNEDKNKLINTNKVVSIDKKEDKNGSWGIVAFSEDGSESTLVSSKNEAALNVKWNRLVEKLTN